MNDNRKQCYFPAGERVSIFRRGKTWYCNYQQNSRQVRRSLGTTSKKQAILQAQRLETELASGEDPSNVRTATVDEVIDAFLAHANAEDRANTTLTKYEQVTVAISKLATSLNVFRIDDVTFRFADAFKQSLRKAGNGPITIYHKTVILRSLTIFAMRRRMCGQDPLDGYSLKKPKASAQPCWTPEQADQIIATAPATYRPLFTFLRETGCRVGEAKYLTWEDIKLDSGVVLIRPKEGDWGAWRPKSGDQRSVPMTDNLRELLQTISKSRPWVFQAPPSAACSTGIRQISERRALLVLKGILKKLSLSGKLHTFRHTFISQALTRGVPEAVVRQWVGHVDASILRLYTHVADEVSQAYVDRFSGK